MEFKFKTLYLGETEHYVWQRDMGNLVIVVIDDPCQVAVADPDDILILDQTILPVLRKHICSWAETRAIGFFRLMGSKTGANAVLEFIHQEWLNKIIDSDTQVYFLVDVLYGDGIGVAVPHIIEKIDKIVFIPQSLHCLSYQRREFCIVVNLPDVCTTFLKGDEAGWAQTHKISVRNLCHFSERVDMKTQSLLMPYNSTQNLGKKNWAEDGWHHDRLQETDSDEAKVLAEWLGGSISISELHKSPHQGESAKSLMIWKGEDLWEEPPWEGGIRRPIQGNVLNAALKKFGIPLSVPKEEAITMPCVPCFPFLVSLRNFLWFCEKEEDRADVEKIHFSKWGENPQVNMISLMLPLKDSARLARKFFGIERQGAFTNALKGRDPLQDGWIGR